jgi:hypothetical protein
MDLEFNPPPHPPQQGPMGGYQMMSTSYIPVQQQQPQHYAGPESPWTVQSPRHMQPPARRYLVTRVAGSLGCRGVVQGEQKCSLYQAINDLYRSGQCSMEFGVAVP